VPQHVSYEPFFDSFFHFKKWLLAPNLRPVSKQPLKMFVGKPALSGASAYTSRSRQLANRDLFTCLLKMSPSAVGRVSKPFSGEVQSMQVWV